VHYNTIIVGVRTLKVDIHDPRRRLFVPRGMVRVARNGWERRCMHTAESTWKIESMSDDLPEPLCYEYENLQLIEARLA
jgi:hypothetical protein